MFFISKEGKEGKEEGRVRPKRREIGRSRRRSGRGGCGVGGRRNRGRKEEWEE